MDVMMEQGVAPEEAIDPMDEMMTFIGELQQKYGMEQEDVDALVDNVNMLLDAEAGVGGEGEEPAAETWTCPECGMEVPADVDVCPECGFDRTQAE